MARIWVVELSGKLCFSNGQFIVKVLITLTFSTQGMYILDLSRTYQVDSMSADALIPYITRSLAAMLLQTWNK